MAGPIPRYLLPDHADVTTDGRLVVSGVDVMQLAEEIGTPFFLYDEAMLRNRCREAADAFGYGTAYASKAFLCKSMARLAYSQGLNLDVASGGEAFTALSAGVPPYRIVLHGNNKSVAELQYAVQNDFGRIVVDSFDELDRLRRVCEHFSKRANVLLRVTPGVEAHTHEFVTTGQEDSKFGFSIESGAAHAAIEAAKATEQFNVAGLHMHIGSQIFDLEPFALAIDRVAPLVIDNQFEELCVGGGLGVPYVEGEAAPSISEWADAVKKAAAAAGIPSTTRITAEPGRSLVAPTAITVYRVGTIKELPGIRTYVSVNGGMSDNPRPVLYGSGYEAFLPRAVDAERTMNCRMVGKHCESGDVLIDSAWLPDDLAVGDLVATPVTGAYGYSMASNYNRILRPPVVFATDGRAEIAVRRETYEDLVRLDA